MNAQIANLGPVENIPLGQGRCYMVNGEEIAVFRQRNGQLFATQNRCPHRQGPLSEGIRGDGRVICPLHGHKFELATGRGSEAGESVKTYHAAEGNGDVILEEQSR
ncbi:MAG TPA: Rieske 2Fe-2S domain-containing protein [Verrucomicrobiae bacterium]